MSPPLPERNRDRHREATARDVAAARAILERVPHVDLTGDAWAALALRALNPEATLQELADMAGVSRSTYSGRLRRALKQGGQE